jgi:dihydroxyacetone kinase
MGIHNEPGVRRQRQSLLSPLITQLFELLTDTSNAERSYLPFKHDGQDEVVLMVNNLGATSELELGGITEASIRELLHKGIRVKRVLVGTYMVCLQSAVSTPSLMIK